MNMPMRYSCAALLGITAPVWLPLVVIGLCAVLCFFVMVGIVGHVIEPKGDK